MVKLTVNGVDHDYDGYPDIPLLWVLRDMIGLTGTKFGCGIAMCGARTVHVGGGRAAMLVAQSAPSGCSGLGRKG